MSNSFRNTRCFKSTWSIWKTSRTQSII